MDKLPFILFMPSVCSRFFWIHILQTHKWCGQKSDCCCGNSLVPVHIYVIYLNISICQSNPEQLNQTIYIFNKQVIKVFDKDSWIYPSNYGQPIVTLKLQKKKEKISNLSIFWVNIETF